MEILNRKNDEESHGYWRFWVDIKTIPVEYVVNGKMLGKPPYESVSFKEAIENVTKWAEAHCAETIEVID